MDSVEIARLLTGMTLAVHIIFATIGVGMPLMFAIAEFIGIKKNDANYITLAKKMVERLHDNRCCWSRYRYYYWFTTFTCLANIYEKYASCYRITTIHGNFAFFLKQSFKYLFIHLGKI